MTIPATNKKFSQEDKGFKEACLQANVAPSTRQASKFRRGKGIALNVMFGYKDPLKKGNTGYCGK
uniref:Uncharacterized protein n=1 Tax=viral metagenome TaxID=1070528 RepID=A0A6M3Y4P3_9ZZZZ